MTPAALHWDIFCHVVDNYGDIGVCWRLAVQLAGRGQSVRLWVDDGAALAWMAPDGCPGVAVIAGAIPDGGYEPADVVIEAFGAALAPPVVAAIGRVNRAGARRVAWINLEYLSAETYVDRSHGLASPVHGGAAAGMRKWFYFPGFTAASGGLLREPGLAARQACFDRAAWLAQWGVVAGAESLVSLFCYEPAVLPAWLLSLCRRSDARPLRLLVTQGRAAAALRGALAALSGHPRAADLPAVSFLPALTQVDFDHLLWSADCNFVRGEDSLVRALWAGVPCVWQLYPQPDAAHHGKLAAFVARMRLGRAPAAYLRWWNGLASAEAPPPLDWLAWAPEFAAARERLLSQDDLVSKLLRFVAENR